VLLVVLVLGVRSCRDSRRERALTDYAQDSGALAQESAQLSSSLFALLGDPGDRSPVEVQSSVNGLAVQAARLADRAGAVEPPDAVSEGHRQLGEVLALRRDGVAGVARQLPTAFADEGREGAARAIAGEMRLFLASDVLYARRFKPAVQRGLTDEELSTQGRVPDAVFLPDLAWLRPETVATRLGRLRSTAEDRAATPGVHGVGVGTITATPSGTQLTPGQPVELAADEGLGFDVAVENQGESEEEVTVRLTVAGQAGAEAIERDKELDEPLPPGESETVSIPLAETPPTDAPTTVVVEVVPVPGEDQRDNNRASLSVTFVGAGGAAKAE
jgi:hypothetical protein